MKDFYTIDPPRELWVVTSNGCKRMLITRVAKRLTLGGYLQVRGRVFSKNMAVWSKGQCWRSAVDGKCHETQSRARNAYATWKRKIGETIVQS